MCGALRVGSGGHDRQRQCFLAVSGAVVFVACPEFKVGGGFWVQGWRWVLGSGLGVDSGFYVEIICQQQSIPVLGSPMSFQSLAKSKFYQFFLKKSFL